MSAMPRTEIPAASPQPRQALAVSRAKRQPPSLPLPLPAAAVYGLNRYPMPDSVSKYRGRDGSGSSLRRSWARYTRR